MDKIEKENFVQGNKLIAEFMGFTPRTDLHTKGELFMQAPIAEGSTHSPCYIVNKADDPHDEFNDLQYHCSWDWLMKAIQKIAKTCLNTNFKTARGLDKMLEKWSPIANDLESVCDIKIIFHKVVAFIKWWNDYNNKK